MLNRFILILIISMVSVFSQVNMKIVANQYGSIANIIEIRPITNLLLVLVRVFFPALISLVLTLYGYTQMGFMQFVLGSTFYYILTPFAYFFIFDERLTPKLILANILVLCGVVLVVTTKN